MGIYGSCSRELIEQQQSIIVSEGVKEIFHSVIQAIKDFINGIIDFIKKLFKKNPDEKTKSKLNDNLDKAKETLNVVNTITPEDTDKLKEAKNDSEEINKAVKEIGSKMGVTVGTADERIELDDPDFDKKFDKLMQGDKPLVFDSKLDELKARREKLNKESDKTLANMQKLADKSKAYADVAASRPKSKEELKKKLDEVDKKY